MKKKLMFLMTCLVLAAACLLGGKPAEVQAATVAYQPLDLRNGVRQKVGGKYFWLQQKDDGTCQLRYSTTSTGTGYLIKSFNDYLFLTGDYDCNLVVTNGTNLYLMSAANTLYTYTLSGSSTGKSYTTKALNTTLKTRLGATKASSKVVAVNSGTVYISARADVATEDGGESWERQTLFALKDGKLRMVHVGSVIGYTEKYLFVDTNNWVLRYNISENDFDYVSRSSYRGITGDGKLFLMTPNDSYTKIYLRAYDVNTLKYVTLKSFAENENTYTEISHYYSECLYYITYDWSNDTQAYYKINVSTKTVTKLKQSTFDAAYMKATGFAIYG